MPASSPSSWVVTLLSWHAMAWLVAMVAVTGAAQRCVRTVDTRDTADSEGGGGVETVARGGGGAGRGAGSVDTWGGAGRGAGSVDTLVQVQQYAQPWDHLTSHTLASASR